ncbi:cytochrome P450 [Streptomyces sp. NPDC006798]|uniref:cytochrome P450 family protein n=1 Tax=Streptomyces sp. NPDC006798 TaxID=3155462 RepID=UPI0033D6F16D
MLDPTGSAPHTEAAALRMRGPAVRVELPGGVIAWSVTRRGVIQDLTTDARVSRDFRKHWPGAADTPEGWSLAPLAFEDSFFNLYGAEHRKSRGRISPAFAPRRVDLMRPRVQAMADRLVAALGALAPGESVDLRQAFSLPLTMTVICDLVGVPAHLREGIGRVMDASLDSTLDPESALAVGRELDERLSEFIAYKRTHPASDLTTDLLLSNAPGQEPLADSVLVGTLFAMINAGYETAVNLITSAVQALLTHPGHLARVREGSIGWDDVIEETLRFEGPVMHVPLRYAIEDIDLGDGVVIRRGEAVIIGFAAAGRDPEVHPDDPDVFDPTRTDKAHLAFGFGPHFCMGAYLARLEADVALTTLFTRLPALSLTDPGRRPARLPSMIVNGPARLDVVPRPETATD